MIEHDWSECAISTSITSHDFWSIYSFVTRYVRTKIALRIVVIPWYWIAVSGCNWCNIDDTVSWTAVKCEDLSNVFSTPEKNFIACYCKHNVGNCLNLLLWPVHWGGCCLRSVCLFVCLSASCCIAQTVHFRNILHTNEKPDTIRYEMLF